MCRRIARRHGDEEVHVAQVSRQLIGNASQIQLELGEVDRAEPAPVAVCVIRHADVVRLVQAARQALDVE